MNQNSKDVGTNSDIEQILQNEGLYIFIAELINRAKLLKSDGANEKLRQEAKQAIQTLINEAVYKALHPKKREPYTYNCLYCKKLNSRVVYPSQSKPLFCPRSKANDPNYRNCYRDFVNSNYESRKTN